MIKRTLIICGLMLIAYTLFLRIWDYEIISDQHQWNKNKIKAEEYIHKINPVNKGVIVGTSLSNRLIMEMLPVNVVSLAFSGLSIYDGLSIIENTKEKPAIIYLEINLVLKNKFSPKLQKELFSPIKYFFKSYCDMFLEKNQPSGILKGFFIYLSYGMKKETERVPKSASEVFVPNKPTKINAQALARHRKNKITALPKAQISEKLSRLKKRINSLQKEGIEVVFFEIPIEPELCDLVGTLALRAQFTEMFPPSLYAYVPFSGCEGYQTTDGYHLDRKSGVRYTKYLKEYME